MWEHFEDKIQYKLANWEPVTWDVVHHKIPSKIIILGEWGGGGMDWM